MSSGLLAAVYASLLLTLSPGKICPDSITANGAVLMCCTLDNGMKCCAQTKDDDGRISGCGCTG